MKYVRMESWWPDSWKQSFKYDQLEVFGGDSDRGYSLAYGMRKQVAMDLITEILEPGARVLDIAAAQGNLTIALAEFGYRVTWNDLREELADYVRLKKELGEIEFCPGNVFELKITAPFDAVMATEIIEHVAHPDEFLLRCAELVRPGGYIILTTPNGAFFRNKLPKFSQCPNPGQYEVSEFRPDSDGHIFLLHPDEMSDLADRAGLAVEEALTFTTPLARGYLRTNSILKMLPLSVIQSIERGSQYLPASLKNRLHIQLGMRLRKSGAPSGDRCGVGAGASR